MYLVFVLGWWSTECYMPALIHDSFIRSISITAKSSNSTSATFKAATQTKPGAK